MGRRGPARSTCLHRGMKASRPNAKRCQAVYPRKGTFYNCTLTKYRAKCPCPMLPSWRLSRALPRAARLALPRCRRSCRPWRPCKTACIRRRLARALPLAAGSPRAMESGRRCRSSPISCRRRCSRMTIPPRHAVRRHRRGNCTSFDGLELNVELPRGRGWRQTWTRPNAGSFLYFGIGARRTRSRQWKISVQHVRARTVIIQSRKYSSSASTTLGDGTRHWAI